MHNYVNYAILCCKLYKDGGMVLACNRQSITPCTMPPKRDPVWEHFLVADGDYNSSTILTTDHDVIMIT
jgi:hypothetical protein